MAQKSKGGVIIAIIGGIAVIGVALFLRARKKASATMDERFIEDQGRIVEAVENSGIRPSEQPSGVKLPQAVSQQNQQRPSYAILTGIENPKLREYIASILDSTQAQKLQGWINTIRQQRAQDASRWKIGEGFTSLNASDVGHGLYQMSQQGLFNWTGGVRDNIVSLQ